MKKKKFLIIFLVIIGVVSLWGWKKGATQRKIFRLKEILEEANALFEKSQWEESLRLFEEFLNNYDIQNPPFPADLYRIYYRIGYCYEEKGDREKADKYWDKTSDEYKPVVEFYRGLRLWKDENYLECREKFLALLDKYPNHPMKENPKAPLFIATKECRYGHRLGPVGVNRVLQRAAHRAKIKRMTIYGGIAGVLMGALNILVLSQANSSSFPEWTKYATDPYNIFILSLRAGLVEETVFRLFLFPVSVWGCALIRKRAESISKIEIMIGAVISSALFGIIHNSGCILAMIMGLLLTAVYYKAGWESCVIAHFITDFIPFMIVF